MKNIIMKTAIKSVDSFSCYSLFKISRVNHERLGPNISIVDRKAPRDYSAYPHFSRSRLWSIIYIKRTNWRIEFPFAALFSYFNKV